MHSSSNLSKAAWGYFDYKQNFNTISYELGVLFLPQYEPNENKNEKSNFYNLSENEFVSLPYDLPPNKYNSTGTVPIRAFFYVAFPFKIHSYSLR